MKGYECAGSSAYQYPFTPKENLIIHMIVDISSEATAIKFSLNKRPSSAIRPTMC